MGRPGLTAINGTIDPEGCRVIAPGGHAQTRFGGRRSAVESARFEVPKGDSARAPVEGVVRDRVAEKFEVVADEHAADEFYVPI